MIQQSTPQYGIPPRLYFTVNGDQQVRGIPCGLEAKVGDFIAVLTATEAEVIRKLRAK